MPGNKIVLGAACTLAALLAHPFGDVVVAAAAAAVVAAVDEPDSSSMYRCDDGTLINASLVNDFFCDCGSDEPRTAACSHVHTAKFLCREDGSLNEGRFIPSSRVNDAICDCCDGSDEDVSLATGDRARAASLGYSERKQSATACPNTCTTLSEDDVKLIRRLAPTRKALVTEARAALAERSARIQHMKEEYPTILTKIEQLKESLLHLEELEAADAVAHAHRHSDALVHKLGLQDFSAQEAFLLFFQYLSAQLETTPGAGRRADAKKNVAFSFGKAPSRTFFAHLLDARPKNSIPSKYSVKEFEKDLSNLNTYINDQAESTRVAIRDLQARLAELEEKIAAEESLMDFGFEQAFYALDGECVSLRDDPFEYQVCPFHNVSQIERAKIGSKETVFDLGRFSQWDPDRPNTMLFGNGKTCPGHGPRKTDVRFSCGEETKLVSVSEDKTCHYLIQATTAAACYATTGQLDALRRKGIDVEEIQKMEDEACALDQAGDPLY